MRSHSSTSKSSDKILYLGTFADKAYVARLKDAASGINIVASLAKISTLTEVTMVCKKRGITKVLTSNPTLLARLVGPLENSRKKPSITNYAGSRFKKDGIEFVIVRELKTLVTVPYGKFLFKRYLSKLTAPSRWLETPEFNWELAGDPGVDLEGIYARYKSARIIGVDIETFKDPLSIRCIGYTAIWFTPKGLESHSLVIPIDSEFNLAWMRKFNKLSPPKVFQNGKYDVAYLSRYNAVPYNWMYDTATLFHSWYSELPKDLGFLQALCVREARYWKDLASTTDLREYYLYNAKDTWATVLVCLAMIQEMPQWALENYKQEFPLVFPCHMTEMLGIARDMERTTESYEIYTKEIAELETSLSTMLGTPNFNAGSPKQMKALLAVLGCKDLPDTSEKNLRKAMFRHPLNERILDLVLQIRGKRKLASTYLKPGKELEGRILYALNPHGTSSGRLASKEHHFWCGVNIQNIPRGPIVKRTYKADPGFKLAEADLAQAESRDTAYISGDANLLYAVEESPDFHCYNASMFFGVPFEEIFDIINKAILKPELRQLSKPVNHGANYNMGAYVLIDTMGLENIFKAKKLLNLPRMWTAVRVAEYLLEQFHKTYPNIKRVFYAGVVYEVGTTKKLVSQATHDIAYQASTEGWTRYCFGNPSKSKADLNSYISHPPQSLNAMTLNKAFMKVFYEIAMNPKYAPHFKLSAQIHDSILFQYREGHEYLKDMVARCMEVPVTITGYDNITRTFTVPADSQYGGQYWDE